MSFPDPLTVSNLSTQTAGTTSETCNRAFISGGRSTYRDSGGEISVEINHQQTGKGRRRHLLKVSHRQLVADQVVPANNVIAEASAHLVINEPEFGFTSTELGDLVKRLVGLMTPANVTKLLNSES